SHPLERSGILAALNGWLRLDLEDWPFRQVLTVLAHNYFQPSWPEWQAGRAAAAAERLVHVLQIPSGRSELVAAIERWSQRDTEGLETDVRGSHTALAGLAAPLVTRMAETLAALPQKATLSGWSAAIGELAASVGLLDAASQSAAGQMSDRAAWQQLLAAL